MADFQSNMRVLLIEIKLKTVKKIINSATICMKVLCFVCRQVGSLRKSLFGKDGKEQKESRLIKRSGKNKSTNKRKHF